MIDLLASSPRGSDLEGNPAVDVQVEEAPAPVPDLSDVPSPPLNPELEAPPLESSCDLQREHRGAPSDTITTAADGSTGPPSNPALPAAPTTADPPARPAQTPPPPAPSSVHARDPPYPQLNTLPPTSPRPPSGSVDKDEEPSVPASFDRSAAPKPRTMEDDLAEYSMRRMHRFTLYETTTRYYIVGSDILDSQFRVMKIDRTSDEGELSITEDEVVYTRDEIVRLLATIEHGNKSTGGLKQRCPFWGLLGFIRFTTVYYMLLITKRSVVAMIGGHYIYQIDSTELIPLATDAVAKRSDANPEEARFIGILSSLDLTRSFYFSYAYDITRTLQHNIIREREALAEGLPHADKHDFNDMFAWNHYLLEPAKMTIKNPYDWCMPIIHGYVDQANINVYGRSIYITIIARRSRYFAGARFLKRGANDLGYVANDVETEQIVSEMITTSFHAPGKQLYANPNYTSYVQHRGSIPLFWTQKNDAATPKPPVEMNLIDPFYSAAALHFDNLFARYGTPVYVLNLVKSRERTPRESILLNEFTQAIKYLNQFLPEANKILYKAWDMSRAAKSRGQDVILRLEEIAETVVNTTGFFHNGSSIPASSNSSTTAASSIPYPAQLQNGVCRTNCIDCLDRTNAAQFVIGKRALGHQLHALGVISTTSIDYDTDAVDLFTHMYHDHGDTIAVQYAGSHLVNTMETYRKINQWKSHPRDMLESFKRYYNNSFLDGQRQEAYNLFLGNYIFTQGQPMLWDLSTDYYLHHTNPSTSFSQPRRNYQKWWTPSNLRPRLLPEIPVPLRNGLEDWPYAAFDDYWLEHYRPKGVTSFEKVFAYNLNSTLRYVPVKATKDGKYDLSPFVVRSAAGAGAGGPIPAPSEAGEKLMKRSRGTGKYRKGLLQFPGYADSKDNPVAAWMEKEKEQTHQQQQSQNQQYHQQTTQDPHLASSRRRAISLPNSLPPNNPNVLPAYPTTQSSAASELINTVASSLAPSLPASELAEYTRYISHPHLLTIPATSNIKVDPNSENAKYINSIRPEMVGRITVREADRRVYEMAVDMGKRDQVLSVTSEEMVAAMGVGLGARGDTGHSGGAGSGGAGTGAAGAAAAAAKEAYTVPGSRGTDAGQAPPGGQLAGLPPDVLRYRAYRRWVLGGKLGREGWGMRPPRAVL